MATAPTASWALASNSGDTFSDALTYDVLVNSANGTSTGSVLVGFSTTGAAASHSVLKVAHSNVTVTGALAATGGITSGAGGLYGVGFSNVASGATYTASLCNAGTAAFGGGVVAANGLYGVGFSNVGGTTYTSTANVTGDVLCTGNVSAGNVGMFRNRIINGNMAIDQRNAGGLTTWTATTSYPGANCAIDRMIVNVLSASSSSPGVALVGSVSTSYGLAGFQNCLTIGCTTVGNGNNDYVSLEHRIEAINISDLGFGTSAASPIVLSFWIMTNQNSAQTYSVCLKNNCVQSSSSPYSIVMPFTVPSGNQSVWQQVVLAIPGPTSGQWATGNAMGLSVNVVLACGSSYFGSSYVLATSSPSWQTTGAQGWYGQTDLMSARGNVVYITGLQLEKGTNATPFEFRPFAIEQQLCQRYYVQLRNATEAAYTSYGVAYAVSGTTLRTLITLPTRLRATPYLMTSESPSGVTLGGSSITLGTGTGSDSFYAYVAGTNLLLTSVKFSDAVVPENALGPFLIKLEFVTPSVGAGTAGEILTSSAASRFVAFSAEL